MHDNHVISEYSNFMHQLCIFKWQATQRAWNLLAQNCNLPCIEKTHKHMPLMWKQLCVWTPCLFVVLFSVHKWPFQFFHLARKEPFCSAQLGSTLPILGWWFHPTSPHQLTHFIETLPTMIKLQFQTHFLPFSWKKWWSVHLSASQKTTRPKIGNVYPLSFGRFA